MRGNITYLVLCLLAVLAAGCRKNEFTLEGSLAGGKGKSLLVVYRASDKEKDFMVENPVILEGEGAFMLKVETRYPTVLWVFATNSGELLMPIYGERGDELKVGGKYNEPWAWRVQGNDVMEEYCDWAAKNINAIMSHDAAKLNAAIASYVKGHKDSRTAAFMLFTLFQTAGHGAEYQQLTATLELDDDEMKEMKVACMAPEHIKAPGEFKGESLRLTGLQDTLVDVNLRGAASGTLLYLWREMLGDDTRRLLRKALGDTCLQTVAVFMDTDTVRWHQMLETDSLLRRSTNLWAPGGEMHPALRELRVDGTPYFILLNPQGGISYRGNNAGRAQARLKK